MVNDRGIKIDYSLYEKALLISLIGQPFLSLLKKASFLEPFILALDRNSLG
jgi:hypothetical protein